MPRVNPSSSIRRTVCSASSEKERVPISGEDIRWTGDARTGGSGQAIAKRDKGDLIRYPDAAMVPK